MCVCVFFIGLFFVVDTNQGCQAHFTLQSTYNLFRSDMGQTGETSDLCQHKEVLFSTFCLSFATL